MSMERADALLVSCVKTQIYLKVRMARLA